jgi:hypothetical protein
MRSKTIRTEAGDLKRTSPRDRKTSDGTLARVVVGRSTESKNSHTKEKEEKGLYCLTRTEMGKGMGPNGLTSTRRDAGFIYSRREGYETTTLRVEDVS